MSRIVILGWGSLLWDLDDLQAQIVGDWAFRAGPRLPMEFSRISAKRRMGLVLALDPEAGRPCATHAILSRRRSIDAAVADLAARERAPIGRIGWALSDGRAAGRLPAIQSAVADWCRATGHDGAVWTDLEPNFRQHSGLDWTVPAGVAYLRSREGEDLAEAYRYIRNAPAATRTPLRRALASDAWWRGLRGVIDPGPRQRAAPPRQG